MQTWQFILLAMVTLNTCVNCLRFYREYKRPADEIPNYLGGTK